MPLTNTFDPSTAVNTGTDVITINSHGFKDRQGVLYHSGGGTAIGGLVNGYKYYVVLVSINSFKLALTEEDAITSTAIDLLSTGSGTTHSFELTNIYPNSAAYYDFFRKVRLLGNGTPAGGYRLEADSVRDSLTIVAGDNIVFENTSEEQDTFTISGSEYDFDIPVGTTELRLYGRVGPVITDDQSIRFSVDRGINITRISDTELRFEGLGVTETDTLHTVTSRGALTSNTLYLNNLEVGIIQSIPGEDGVTNFTSTGTTGVAINLTGDGTLDSPGEIDLPSTSEASKTVQINFTLPVSGTLTYSASYKAESALTTGSIILQREDPLSPGTWATIDSASGTTARYAYTIQNIYAELNTSGTNFRIITSWTGLSTGYVDFPINLQFEISPIYINEMIRTDTAAGDLFLGRLEGDVFIRGTINVIDVLKTDGLRIFQNNIEGLNSNENLVIDPNGTGAVELRTQTLNTDQTTFNLLDVTATTVNAFGAATAINIGANTGTITIENPTLVGTVATQYLYDTTATTVNAFGDATAINIGDNTGTITLRNPTLVGTETTQNIYDTVATTVNAFGAATTIDVGATTGTITINNPTLVGTQTTQNVYDTVATTVNAFGAATTIDIGATTGTITINNPTLVGTQTTQNVYDTVATTVNAFGAATTIDIGATTGTITVNNPTLVGTQTTQNLYNTVATTVNAFGAATLIELGAATGTTNINNNLQVDLDLEVRGGDITTNQTTFNLLNTTATTINAFGAATTINFGSLIITGDTIDTNDSSAVIFTPAVTFDSNIQANDVTVNQDLVVQGNLTVNGSTVTLNTSTLDVEDLNITVAKGAPTASAANGAGITVDGAGASITYASSDDSWNLNKQLKGTSATLSGNLQVDGNLTFGSNDSDSITSNAFFVSGTQLKSGKANANTLALAAYDVDGTAYTNLVTLTASNTPTLVLTSIGTGSIDNMSIGATTASTGRFSTLKVGDSIASGRYLQVSSGSTDGTLTADRTLTFDVGDADRSIKLRGGGISLSGGLISTGGYSIEFIASGTTNLNLPQSGTLATLAGSESLTNKKLGSLTTNGIVTTSAGDGTLSVTATTGSGSVVLGTSPTIATPDITFKNAAVTGNADYVLDASTTTLASWIASFTATRNLSVTNLTAGRMIRVYIRNTSASAQSIQVFASTTTTGAALVNLAGNFVGANPAGQVSSTFITLAGSGGTAVVTVFNAGGNLVGMVN